MAHKFSKEDVLKYIGSDEFDQAVFAVGKFFRFYFNKIKKKFYFILFFFLVFF